MVTVPPFANLPPMKHRAVRSGLFAAAVGLALIACVPRATKSWSGRTPPIQAALDSLLEDPSHEISVAPIVGSVETTFSAAEFAKQGFDIHQWKATMRNELLTFAESEVLRVASKYPNFKLVDRTTTQEVLSELKLSTAVSNSDRIKLGNTLGVTHLIVCDLVRYPEETAFSRYKIADRITGRLIEVQSGRVLVTESMIVRR
jgi:hypothetical protein